MFNFELYMFHAYLPTYIISSKYRAVLRINCPFWLDFYGDPHRLSTIARDPTIEPRACCELRVKCCVSGVSVKNMLDVPTIKSSLFLL